MLSNNRKNEILAEVANCVGKLNIAYNVLHPVPVVKFNLRGTRAGQIQYSSLRGTLLRFNQIIADDNFSEFIGRTPAHEVAHAYAIILWGDAGHGTVWKQIMNALGKSPERCHNYNTERAAQKSQYMEYTCNCSVHSINIKTHNKVRKGANFICKDCQKTLSHTGYFGKVSRSEAYDLARKATKERFRR